MKCSDCSGLDRMGNLLALFNPQVDSWERKMKAIRKVTWAFAVALALVWSACVTTTGQSRSATLITPSSVDLPLQPASAAT